MDVHQVISQHRIDLRQNFWRPFIIHCLNRNCLKSESHLRTEVDWTPTASSVMHEKIFREDAMCRGKQRASLKRK